jgi:hypothetical protein
MQATTQVKRGSTASDHDQRCTRVKLSQIIWIGRDNLLTAQAARLCRFCC